MDECINSFTSYPMEKVAVIAGTDFPIQSVEEFSRLSALNLALHMNQALHIIQHQMDWQK